MKTPYGGKGQEPSKCIYQIYYLKGEQVSFVEACSFSVEQLTKHLKRVKLWEIGQMETIELIEHSKHT